LLSPPKTRLEVGLEARFLFLFRICFACLWF
jgi:hypothetical protein